MADNNDRIVFPDEVEAVKEAAKSKVVQGDVSNSVEEPPPDVGNSEIRLRNLVTVPPNCPRGQEMGEDGQCRELL